MKNSRVLLILILCSCSLLPWVRNPNSIGEWVKAPAVGETLLYSIYSYSSDDTVYSFMMINEYRLVLDVEKKDCLTVITYRNTGIETDYYSYDGEAGEEGETLYVDTSYYAIDYVSGMSGPYDPAADSIISIKVKTPVAEGSVFEADNVEKRIYDINIQTYVQGTEYFDCYGIDFVEFDDDSLGSFSGSEIYSPVLGRCIYYSTYTSCFDDYTQYSYYSEEYIK